MRSMIYRFSLDVYIYVIDQQRMLVVLGVAWQALLDAGYSSDTLYDPQFWLPLVGQSGVLIKYSPYPVVFGRP